MALCRRRSRLWQEEHGISRFDMSCAPAHWVGSKPIRRVMQLKLHKPTMVIGYSLRTCARHVVSANPGPSNLVFRSKPIPEAEMSNRLMGEAYRAVRRPTICGPRRRLLLIGAPPPPICRRAADAIVGCWVVILLQFSMNKKGHQTFLRIERIFLFFRES